MSLRKKIIFSFFISAFIIAILAVFEYINYVQIKGEMRFLEVTDTIRSKSLQLRRHEKNFFLYPSKASDESKVIYNYIDQLEDIARGLDSSVPGKASSLEPLVHEYEDRFSNIEKLLGDISRDFDSMQGSLGPNIKFAPLIETNFRDRPFFAADFLESVVLLPKGHPIVVRLRELDSEIDNLRKTGEKIIEVSKILDKSARDNADRGIRVSQIAILAVFPIFLIIGIGALFSISNDVVKRLKKLTDSVDRIGKRYEAGMPARKEVVTVNDEVDVLVGKFNRMNRQLAQWEEELYEKNQELLQSKKLVAIGTLAAGVAHELNNPLNNINLSAQVLRKRLSDDTDAEVGQIVEDIAGQTTRVKGIVGDLLEFAREREPHVERFDLVSLVRRAYHFVGKTSDTAGVTFTLDAPEEEVMVSADPGQIERVFVNLFSNAIQAMEGSGELVAKIYQGEQNIYILVSDNGRGMSEEEREKVFDPFFTTSDKGTGLGLAIVLNIIHRHNGHISVVSEKGEGTAFEITLPKGE